MISEELLRRAAARSCEHYAAGLAQDYDPAEAHVFSPVFEQRMARLCRRAEHPALYIGLRRAAASLLAALVTGTAWLSVDVNAREQFAGWLREVRENGSLFRIPEDVTVMLAPGNFRPAWIPEGYTLKRESSEGSRIVVIYENHAGEYLRFSYIYKQGGNAFAIATDGGERQPYKIGSYTGEIIMYNDLGRANDLIWTDREGRLFHISGFLKQEELVKMAESIYE